MAISKEKQESADMGILPQIIQSHPWLVMCGGKEGETQTFYSISKGRYYTKNIPELANKMIFSNCMEWLVLVDYDNMECSLLNMISMEKIELPKYDDMYFCACCNITCPPGDPNCRIVFIDNMHDNICICKPGDDKFIKNKVQLLEGATAFSSATCFDGSIYVILDPSFSLIKANLNDPTLEFQIMVNGESVQKEFLDVSTHPYLAKSCGELLMVNKSRLHENSFVFHVFRADFSTSKWVLLKSIGDRAIFLQPLSSQGITCSSSESGIQANCIYYTEEENRTLYIFNMENQSNRVTIPCPTINLINLTTHWVMIPPQICLMSNRVSIR